MKVSKKQRIYLDHASTTAVAPEVLKAMVPYFSKQFYNTTALYKEGVDSNRELSRARKSVAENLHALSDEIIFTGSGTEADNIAVLGVLKASLKIFAKPHIILSTIEHPAIIELIPEIRRMGGEVTMVPVNEFGIVNPNDVRDALKASTVLVSVMYANNEVGTIQPIREIAKSIRHHKKNRLARRQAKVLGYPYFHTDASQAANYCSLNILQLGVDLLTLDGSKIYGPKGVGMLFVKRNTAIEPIIFGGGQEMGLRSGTESLASIVGFATALSMSVVLSEKESKRLTKLRDETIKKILKKFPESSLNGHHVERLPNNINICFPGIDGEFAVIKADALGIMCSTASSCRTLSENSHSYVLEAMGNKQKCSESSLRFSLGRGTTSDHTRALLKLLPSVIKSSIK